MAGAPTIADLRGPGDGGGRLLSRNMDIRRDVSPYRQSSDFDTLIRQFDQNSGWNSQDPKTGLSLKDTVARAEQDLGRAPDLYAYPRVCPDPAAVRKLLSSVCSTNPAADDPLAEPPVVDWCNFAVADAASTRNPLICTSSWRNSSQ